MQVQPLEYITSSCRLIAEPLSSPKRHHHGIFFDFIDSCSCCTIAVGQFAGTKSYNGLTLTPQMGWNNWNAFACSMNEEKPLRTAQRIVDFGLKGLGGPVLF